MAIKFIKGGGERILAKLEKAKEHESKEKQQDEKGQTKKKASVKKAEENPAPNPWPPKEFCTVCHKPRLHYWWQEMCADPLCLGKFKVPNNIPKEYRRWLKRWGWKIEGSDLMKVAEEYQQEIHGGTGGILE